MVNILKRQVDEEKAFFFMAFFIFLIFSVSIYFIASSLFEKDKKGMEVKEQEEVEDRPEDYPLSHFFESGPDDTNGESPEAFLKEGGETCILNGQVVRGGTVSFGTTCLGEKE